MVSIIEELRYKIRKSCTANVASHVVTKQLIIFQYGCEVSVSTPVKIVKNKRGKPLKSGEKTIVLNVLNKFKRIYKFIFKQIRFPYTSKRTLHCSSF